MDDPDHIRFSYSVACLVRMVIQVRDQFAHGYLGELGMAAGSE